MSARGAGDLDSTFAEITRAGAGGLVVVLSTMLVTNRARVARLALSQRLPTICATPEEVEAGSLMSFAPNYPALYRRGAYFVDKILRGAKPADLPVEQPTKFDLVINSKTAKALLLNLPPSLLLRADHVIQ